MEARGHHSTSTASPGEHRCDPGRHNPSVAVRVAQDDIHHDPTARAVEGRARENAGPRIDDVLGGSIEIAHHDDGVNTFATKVEEALAVGGEARRAMSADHRVASAAIC